MPEEDNAAISAPLSETELKGQVERITYHNEENGYTVLRMSVPGHAELITVVDNMPEPAPGEMLSVAGKWEKDPRYGMQLHAVRCEPAVPASAEGVEKFLASGLIRGVGPATAKKIVEFFGDDTLSVLDEEPERLLQVKGINGKKAEDIAQSWREQRDIREAMVFLQGYGIGAGYAMRIFRRYGSATVAALKENPYCLAQDVYGIGFTTADKIAARIGIAHDSPLRVRAGVRYVLNQMTGDGHVFVPSDILAAQAAQTLAVGPELAAEGIAQAAAAGNIVLENYTDKDGTEREAVYLPAFHYAETVSAKNLISLADEPYNRQFVDCEKALPWLEREMGITFADAQKEAIKMAAASKVMVITGGPGTGKTTIIRAVLHMRESGGFNVMLAAPTGRAAKRMAEATGHEAKTIHRLLEYNGAASQPFEQASSLSGTGVFMRNETNPLRCDLLIVDEASMIDQILFHHLLKAVPPGASLIFVGDVNQLPSVSPGNVLKDLIDSGICPVAELREIFRQGRESSIIVNAHRINGGLMPLLPETGKDRISDFYFIEPSMPAEGELSDDEYRNLFDAKVMQTIKKLVSENIPNRFGFDPVNDIQVLSPMHNGMLGTKRLNIELQKLLNKGRGASVQRLDRVFREGDKVMQVKNNYDKDVYNGDIGTVVSVDGEESCVTVKMETGFVTYEFAELEELVHAYAVSIHKSQGSEYPAVVIPLLTQHYIMLQRNLLYTAVTRGKKLVVIVGQKKALRIAVENDKMRTRYTRLAERLKSRGLPRPLPAAE